MKERALKLAARLEEIGQVKDMGRPPVNDTERESAALIREMQSRLEELNQKVEGLEKGAARLHNEIMNIPAKCAVLSHDGTAYKEGHRDARHAAAELVAAMQANKGE